MKDKVINVINKYIINKSLKNKHINYTINTLILSYIYYKQIFLLLNKYMVFKL